MKTLRRGFVIAFLLAGFSHVLRAEESADLPPPPETADVADPGVPEPEPTGVMTPPPEDDVPPEPEMPGAAVPAPPDSEPLDPPPIEPAPVPTDAPTGAYRSGAPIEAKAYDLTIVRPSRSGGMYLLQKDDSDLPLVGRLFLLRTGTVPVMGFRVVKTFAASNQIAAKKVRVYEDYEELKHDSRYRAYEKIGDIAAPPPLSRQDRADLSEFESGSMTVPSAAPPPVGGAMPAQLAPEEDSTRPESYINDEEMPRDYYPNWLTAEFGLFYNKNAPGSAMLKGGGLRYGRNIGFGMFRLGPHTYDSLTLEGGIFHYRVLTDEGGTSKVFTVLPMNGILRYNIQTSDSFALYFYGGFVYNYVASQLNATEEEIIQLQTTAPALGGGLLFQLGPGWDFKVNLGLDALSAGIALRF